MADDNGLQEMVQNIADQLTNWEEYKAENPSSEGEGDDYGIALDWLQDALDINYIVNADKSFKSARVLVAFGGPNIWVNFNTNTVEGYWWMNRATAEFSTNQELEDALEELYSC